MIDIEKVVLLNYFKNIICNRFTLFFYKKYYNTL